MLVQKTLRLGLLYMFSSRLFAVARADEKPCTTHSDGNFYDLSGLGASEDYEFASPSGSNYKYVMNVCKSISQETWAIKVDKPEDVAGFTRRAHGDFSMGDVNTTVLFREGNPVILMTDGSRCPNAGDLTASTAIRFICDSSAGTGKPKMIATLPPDDETACSFFVEWRTERACPASQGVWGTVLLTLFIIAVVLLLLYIAGDLFNRYILKPRGMDVSFFSCEEALEILRDCIGRVKDVWSDAWRSRNWGTQQTQHWGSGGSWGRSAGSHGYSGLRATPEEAETMLGGPPGFLDEEDEDDEEAPRQSPQENSRPIGMDSNGVIRL